MKILHFIFNLINPEEGKNWLSIQYHRWLHKRKDELNRRYYEYDKDRSVYFDVKGAGRICVSKNCHYSTMDVVGFSFACEWSDDGFSGGVLGRSEAKMMAEYILEKCNEVKETEQEERDIIKKRYEKQLEERQHYNGEPVY